MKKLNVVLSILYIAMIVLNLLIFISFQLKYDSLFAKCEQDKEIEIYGNKYWCVKIQNKKE